METWTSECTFLYEVCPCGSYNPQQEASASNRWTHVEPLIGTQGKPGPALGARCRKKIRHGSSLPCGTPKSKSLGALRNDNAVWHVLSRKVKEGQVAPKQESLAWSGNWKATPEGEQNGPLGPKRLGCETRLCDLWEPQFSLQYNMLRTTHRVVRRGRWNHGHTAPPWIGP